MKTKKIIDKKDINNRLDEIIKVLFGIAIDIIERFFACFMILTTIDADTATKALDELDHITLGKIDYYKHTDYERDLLIATVMKR